MDLALAVPSRESAADDSGMRAYVLPTTSSSVVLARARSFPLAALDLCCVAMDDDSAVHECTKAILQQFVGSVGHLWIQSEARIPLGDAIRRDVTAFRGLDRGRGNGLRTGA